MLAQCYRVRKNQVKTASERHALGHSTPEFATLVTVAISPSCATKPGGLMAASQLFVAPDGQPWFRHRAGSSCRRVVLPPVLDGASSRTSVGIFLSPSYLLILAMPLFIHITVGGVPFRLITVILLFVQGLWWFHMSTNSEVNIIHSCLQASVGILDCRRPPSENSKDIRVG